MPIHEQPEFRSTVPPSEQFTGGEEAAAFSEEHQIAIPGLRYAISSEEHSAGKRHRVSVILTTLRGERAKVSIGFGPYDPEQPRESFNRHKFGLRLYRHDGGVKEFGFGPKVV